MFVVASTAFMHLLGPVEVLPSAVATHAIVRLPLFFAGGQKIEEWIRPKAPETAKAYGPQIHTPAADAAAFAESVRAWTVEQLAGRPATVGSLRRAAVRQLFVDDAWSRWLALARIELTAAFGDSLGRAAATYKFEAFDPVERACKGVTRRSGRAAAPAPPYVVAWALRRVQETKARFKDRRWGLYSRRAAEQLRQWSTAVPELRPLCAVEFLGQPWDFGQAFGTVLEGQLAELLEKSRRRTFSELAKDRREELGAAAAVGGKAAFVFVKAGDIEEGAAISTAGTTHDLKRNFETW